jgi:hypothetical protein
MIYEIFWWTFSLKIILEVILFLGFYLAINWLNMIYLWISKIEVIDFLRGHLY